jgi:hypothetical protein
MISRGACGQTSIRDSKGGSGKRSIYLEIDERLDFLDKIDDKENVEKWQKHLKCLTNPLAK